MQTNEDTNPQVTGTEAANGNGSVMASYNLDAVRKAMQHPGDPSQVEAAWRLLMLAEAQAQTAELRAHTLELHAVLGQLSGAVAELKKVTAAIERLEARFPSMPTFLGKRRA